MIHRNKQSGSNKSIGLALGGGAARGWAHIGVIRELKELGITPDIICGSSIGALVGSAYASGSMDRLEQWVLKLDWQGTVKFFDISLHGGLIEGKKLFDFFADNIIDINIEDLSVKFTAIATNLETGHEVLLSQGSTLEAVRASIALPGLFTPVLQHGQWLADGALVNPVPVSVCRAMGADIVIAVDLVSNLAGRHLKKENNNNNNESPLTNKLRQLWSSMISNGTENNKRDTPSIFDTMASALNILQIQITRGRLIENPPDILITPRLEGIGLMEFYRAEEAINAGKSAVRQSIKELQNLD